MKRILLCILVSVFGAFCFTQSLHAADSPKVDELELLLRKIRDCDETSIKDEELLKQSLREISSAFETLGSKAEPILPQLTNIFLSGRSTVASLRGLRTIGGTSAGLAIAVAITNISERVRFNAIAVKSEFDANKEVSEKATEALLGLLESRFQRERAGACHALGRLHAKPDLALPALLKVTQKDNDIEVRRIALLAISRFKSDARPFLPVLEQIASQDPNSKVRGMAERAIAAISQNEQNDPNK
jgi:hypothetical protein